MKVLMLNGSPRKEGCTYTALIQIAGVLEKNGIESEIFQAGTPELENVRAAAEKMKEADALTFSSSSALRYTGHLQAGRSSNLWISSVLLPEKICC